MLDTFNDVFCGFIIAIPLLSNMPLYGSEELSGI
jgi:hypothetical protein